MKEHLDELLNAHGRTMSAVALPHDARERVAHTIETHPLATEDPHPTVFESSGGKGLLGRRTLLVAVSVAAVLCLALAAAQLTGTKAAKNGTLSTGSTDTLILSAYADGTAIADAQNAVLASPTFLSGAISWFTAENETTGAIDTVCIDFPLDLSCTGDGIEKLKYSLDGSNVTFKALSNQHPDDKEANPAARGADGNGTTDLVVTDPAAITSNSIYLEVRLPLTGTLLELNEKLSNDGQAWSEMGVESATQAIKEISQHVLTIKATLANGKSVTHTYRIAPCDNFREQYRSFAEEFTRSLDKSVDTAYSQRLFTITQLS